MIHSFSIKNFASFKREAVIDFSVQNSIYKKTVTDCEKEINKISMVIGHNASGKTTILKGLGFVAWFISNSFYLGTEEDLPLSSFFFNRRASQFKMNFSFEEKLYFYELDLSSTEVLREELSYLNRGKKIIVFSYNSKGDGSLKVNSKFLSYKVELKKNCSFVSLAKQHKSQWAEKICHYLESWKTNITQGGKSSINHKDWDNFVNVGKWYYENPLMLKLANKVLSQLDLGFKGLDIIPLVNPISNKTDYLTYGYHELRNGSKEQILLLDESCGTQNLFYLLNRIFPVLKDGGVVILDEFDNELHSHMLPLLFNLFYSHKLNPYNGQLVFSSHHHQILENLSKNQVFFVEKPSYSESQVTRLDSLKKVKFGPRLLKDYYNKLLTYLS